MALLSHERADTSSIIQGVQWLVKHQNTKNGKEEGTWPMLGYTATGFPGHLYLEYEYYRHYFPVMALGRWCSEMAALKRF